MRITAGKIYGKAVRDHWLAYFIGILAMVVTSLSEVMVPKVIQWSLDIVTSGGGAEAVVKLRWASLILGIGLIAGLVGRVAWRQILARRTHIAGRDLKVAMWDSLRFQPLRILHTYSVGDLMNRATGDWSASRTIFGFSIVLTADIIFFTIFSLVAMLTIDVSLTVYTLLIFPPLPYMISRIARQEHDLHAKAQESLGVLSDHVAESLGSIRLSRATATGAEKRAQLVQEARDYAEKRFKVVKTGWKIFPLGAFPTLFAYGILMVAGIAKVKAGTLTMGQFVALQSYVLMLQTPLFELGDCIAEWQKGWASLSRIAEILNLKKPSHGHALVETASFAAEEESFSDDLPILRIHHLNFAYPQHGEGMLPKHHGPLVLNDISLTIFPGERIGIYGPVGAGKSTLIHLIAGLSEAPRGCIFLGGVDVSQVPQSWYARHLTIVPQKAFLFAGSIRKNLLLHDDLPEAELWQVLDDVGLMEMVKAMPDGLDSWIGEWGITLSGGQRQRLALARALLRPRQLLLLDDCLSAVDTVTEDRILTRLHQRLGESAIIWVAHRPSTLKLCESIYFMDQGRLIPSSEDDVAHLSSSLQEMEVLPL